MMRHIRSSIAARSRLSRASRESQRSTNPAMPHMYSPAQEWIVPDEFALLYQPSQPNLRTCNLAHDYDCTGALPLLKSRSDELFTSYKAFRPAGRIASIKNVVAAMMIPQIKMVQIPLSIPLHLLNASAASNAHTAARTNGAIVL